MSDATIVVRFDIEAIHCWPDAPLSEGYLAYPHRHKFFFEVSCVVAHDDREIEFHALLKDCKRSVSEEPNWGAKSCEMAARELATKLQGKYKRTFTVSCFEDNECGAVVTV